ncbi:MAG: response regulator [Alphaproteobacteria bacterium]
MGVERNNRTILVVEDNDFVRTQVCSFLSDGGYETVESTDGQHALGIVANHDSNIDLAIVDVRMEPLNGLEFIRRIRGDDINTPIILVTGDDNPDLLRESSRLGVGAVLKKPVQKDRLIKIVSRTLHIENN